MTTEFSPARAPEHYRGRDGLEPWHVVDAFELDYYLGSALKYILRAGKKGPKRDDITKAINFLARARELEEGRVE